MDFKKVESNIRSCVISTKHLTLKQLNHDYKTLMGEWIPFRELGFNSLEQLIESSKLLALERHGSNTYVVAARSEKSSHISELVSQQKSAKSKPSAKFKPKNSKWVQPPRMQPHYQQQQTGGRWRPKANYQMNSYNNYSSRPQAVNHSQFVIKTPSVASKVVIPEHSTFYQKPAPQPSVSTTPDINQRLNTKRLQENMVKTTVQENRVNSEQSKLYRLGHKDIGLSPNSNLHVTKPISELNNMNAKNTPTNNNLVADLSLSARSRISKKMSELKLDSGKIDRDSGNSSPTNESLPSPSKVADFPRTGDHVADLKRFVVLHKLGEIEESTTSVLIRKVRTYSCKIKIASYPPWSSYPEDFHNPADAKVRCYEKALDELIPRFKRKSLLISSQEDVLERVPPLLEKHSHGVWAWQLLLDYTDKYNEILPDDWTTIVDVSPYVHIEKMLDNYILYHCQPGDKGQQRTATAVDVSNVSVPANTVKFGEDNRLLAQITCVISAKEVWCEQVGTKERELFDEMFGRLQLYYKQNESKCIPNLLLPGGYYIAKYEEGYYYRVRILTLNEDEVECFSIDSGAEITVKKTDIFVLRRDYATSEAQAFVCRLIGLEDLYDMTINSDCLAALEDQTVILELAEDLSDNNGNLVLPVCMYYTDTGSSINEELITKLTAELATPTLKEGINEVYISHIDPTGDVLVYIKSKAYDNLQQLRQQVEKQIIANPPRNVPKVTMLDRKEKLYFMKDCTSESGVWRRTQIIDWCPDGMFAQVYFVDDGHTNIITVANEVLYPLDTLHDVFSNYPHQAIRVKMALKTIPVNFVDITKTALPKNEPVLLKIIGTKDDCPLVKLFKRNADGLFCINESLDLECELKQKDDQFRNKLNVPQLNPDTVPSTGTLKCPPLPTSSEEFFPVQISMAVNPYNFFVQPLESLPQLEKLMDKLQELYKNVKYGNLKIEDVLPGHIYASTYTDGRWYRISVIKVLKSGSVSVFYCDYGYYQTLPVSQLVFLDKEFMELPYQALKAKLGVKPKQSKWTMEDCEEFKKLVEKKPFFARLLEIENDFLYESDILLKVVLVDTSDKDTDVFIEEELVKRGIAIFD